MPCHRATTPAGRRRGHSRRHAHRGSGRRRQHVGVCQGGDRGDAQRGYSDLTSGLSTCSQPTQVLRNLPSRRDVEMDSCCLMPLQPGVRPPMFTEGRSPVGGGSAGHVRMAETWTSTRFCKSFPTNLLEMDEVQRSHHFQVSNATSTDINVARPVGRRGCHRCGRGGRIFD